ncbi:AMP-binding protein [Candidatus Poriferisocius sp.]|uniref:AMP-binding protein n=1 Tax=Candidatus Poriferisocius sp. TaxID=3101276 RepID=UPI003B5CD8F3
MRPCDYLDRGAMLAGRGSACLTTDHQSLTYGEVTRATHGVARELAGTGATPTAKVGVYSPNHPSALIAILGIARAGCTYVAVNTANAVADNAAVLESTGCEILYYHSRYEAQARQLSDAVSTLNHIITIDTHDTAERWSGDAIGVGQTTDSLPHAPEDLAYLLPTGGTTGPAKSVMLTNANLEALVANQLTALPGCDHAVYLVSAPITHGAGIMTLGFLATGATVHMLDGVDPEAVLNAIEGRKVTHLFFPPTAIYKLLAHQKVREYDYSSLRAFVYAAAPMATEKLREAIDVFGPVMAEVYGQSEHPFATILTAPEHSDALRQDPERLASCGRPTAFTSLAILDDNGSPCACGERGEIALRGQGVSPGYFNDPDSTAAVRRNGWHLTGDVGVCDEEGYVYVVDRKKDMIITGGFNVYPTEVEQVIHQLDGVVDVAVVGVPDPKWGEAVKAVIEVRPGSRVAEEAVIGACKERLGSVKAPKSVDVWEALPRSGPGKVLKREIRDHYWEGHDHAV